MNHDTLSDLEIDSLLAGLAVRERAAPLSHFAQITASDSGAALALAATELQRRLEVLAPALIVTARPPSVVVAEEISATAIKRDFGDGTHPIQLLCSRQLISSLVDYRFGGSGAPASNLAEALSPIERRTADWVFDALAAVWRDGTITTPEKEYSAADLPEPTRWALAVFDVSVGAGGGELTVARAHPDPAPSDSPDSAEPYRFIACLGRIRLDRLDVLEPGAVIEVTREQPISIHCAGKTLLCRHGAHAGCHALRVLAVETTRVIAAQAPASSASDIEFMLELGRASLDKQAFEQLAVGDLIELDRGLDQPLSLMREGTLYGQCEVLVSPSGFAVRIMSIA